MTDPNTNRSYYDSPQNLGQFASKSICESCLKSSEAKNLSDRLNFSEVKEEEKDCHYCHQEHIKRSAETLFNGRPSCKECKKKNFINFVSPTMTGQRIMITQVVQTNSNQNSPLIDLSVRPGEESSLYKSRTVTMFPPNLNLTNQTFDIPEGPLTNRSNHGKAISLKNESELKNKLRINLPNESHNELQNSRLQLGCIDDSSDYGSDNGFSFPQQFLSARCTPLNSPKTIFHPLLTPKSKSNNQNYFMHVKQSQSSNLSKAPNNELNTSLSSFISGIEIYESKKEEGSSSPKKIEFRDAKVGDILSKILTGGINSVKSNLVYLASKDTLGSKFFHSKCDGKAPLILALMLQSGAVFGGFMYKALNPKSLEIKDEKAGLFYTVENNNIMFQKVIKDVIIYKKTGVIFGNPIMLEINFDTLNNVIWNIDSKLNSSVKKTPEWSKHIKDILVLKF